MASGAVSPIELRYFGIDRDEAPAMYAEALEVILRGMICKELSFEGKYYRYTDAAVPAAAAGARGA